MIDILGNTDTFTTTEGYDIIADSWTFPDIPSPINPTGLWAPDIVSMIQHTCENMCFIIGSASTPGGADTNSLYANYPDSMTALDLGEFSYSPMGIDFAFAWYVPWIGAAGGICAGGGIDLNNLTSGDTQCYDIDADTFNALNTDLGPLPQPWWSGGDAWKMNVSQYELLGLNGSDVAFNLLQKSFYWNITGFVMDRIPYTVCIVWRLIIMMVESGQLTAPQVALAPRLSRNP